MYLSVLTENIAYIVLLAYMVASVTGAASPPTYAPELYIDSVISPEKGARTVQ